MKLNAAQQLFVRIGGTALAIATTPSIRKTGERPTKYRNAKQKRYLQASTYHQNPARTYAEALAEDAQRMGVQS